jgi:hypothetical protein
MESLTGESKCYEIDFGSGKLVPVTEAGKNDLANGTILKFHGYSDPELVVVGKVISGYDKSTMYDCINLQTMTYAQHEARFLSFEAEGRKGIHVAITLEFMDKELLPELQEIATLNIELAKVQAEMTRKAEAEQAEALKSKYSHLIPGAGAAKNIRADLKKNFPGVKFSVRMEHYGSINIKWENGPTGEAVEKITDRYVSGYFDGMDDSYHNTHSVFGDVFGSEKYVSCYRDTGTLEESLFPAFCALVGVEVPEHRYNAQYNGDSVYTILRNLFSMYDLTGRTPTGVKPYVWTEETSRDHIHNGAASGFELIF